MKKTHALLMSTSIFLHSSGRPGTNFLTSSGLLMSSFKGRTLTPFSVSFRMSVASSSSLSMRRAVNTSRRSFLGAVRANSKALLRPMPEDAPVMRIVLACRRLAAAEEEDMALVSGITRDCLKKMGEQWKARQGDEIRLWIPPSCMGMSGKLNFAPLFFAFSCMFYIFFVFKSN